MQESIVRFNLSSENNFYLSPDNGGKPSNQAIYLYFELTGQRPTNADQVRIPLNISLVIDRSGSMQGDKLKYAKAALSFVIDQMQKDDQISMVAYDHLVDVVQPQHKVTAKNSLHRKINAIVSRGSTNLSGGMLEGFSQVAAMQEQQRVNRVLLLSDGLANQGVTDPQALHNLVQKQFRTRGIGLSTFGVGADYNEDLMTNLSEYGGGNYFFIESADKIPTMFAHELQGLLSVVAQGAVLEIAFPPAVRFAEVFGYTGEVVDNVLRVPLNDIFAEEEKALAVKFLLNDSAGGDLTFSSTLRYTDVVERLEPVIESRTLTLKPTSDPATYQSGIHLHALDNVTQFYANSLLEQAIAHLDQMDAESARATCQRALAHLEGVFRMLKPSPELQEIHQSIVDYHRRIDEIKAMSVPLRAFHQKGAKASQYYSRKRRRYDDHN
ncbi:MAG: VWA domain-containing protein [Bacteroidota bacterium]